MNDDDMARKMKLTADLLQTELGRRGVLITEAACYNIARRVYLLLIRGEVHPDLPAGHVARYLRDRYDGDIEPDQDPT